MAGNDGCTEPCLTLRRLSGRCEEYRSRNEERMRRSEVSMATINAKLNWLIGLLSALGTAGLAVLLKLATGT